MSFDNLGLHTEYLTPLSLSLLIIGGILGYGGSHILKLFTNTPDEKAALVIKILGLIFAAIGLIMMFKRGGI